MAKALVLVLGQYKALMRFASDSKIVGNAKTADVANESWSMGNLMEGYPNTGSLCIHSYSFVGISQSK